MSVPVTPRQRRAHWTIFACFLLALFAAVSWSFWYTWNDNIQLEGVSLGLALVFLAAGIGLWAKHLMADRPAVTDFPDLRSPARSEAELVATLERGDVGRRRLLLGSAGAVGVGLTAGVLVNLRSFEPDPSAVKYSPWRRGIVMVDPEDGKPITASDFPVGGLMTAMPKGFTNAVEAAALIIHLPPGTNHPLPGRKSWAAGDFVAYSKICTHAGCPINLYDRIAEQLVCPCHQSTFQVNHGCRPVFGPAGRRLPQLPIALDGKGRFYTTGPFSSPPGPTVWVHGEP